MSRRKFWALLLVFGSCALLASGSQAAGETAHAHGHGHAHAAPAPAAMPADGRKWPTDAPLRQSMANIRSAFAASLHEIHAGKLSAAAYGTLSQTVRDEVDAMVRNCKLYPQADAQLHLVIGDMLQGAEAMEGKMKRLKRSAGAAKVLRALEDYGTRFDDPGWQPLSH